ncbi:MAG: CRISPR-associated endonuclease Cas1 [Ectothiorhodospira sp.]
MQPRNGARQDTLHEPARKPLYLLEGPREVTARDTSLAVRNGPQVTNLPLSRLDRILSGLQVTWSGEALRACLGFGIPITWVDGSGHPLGTLNPPPACAGTMADAIQRYLDRPEWTESYIHWLKHRRMDVLQSWRNALSRRGHPPPARILESIKRDFVYADHIPNHFPDESLGWCYGVVEQRLNKEGLQPYYWGYGGAPLPLAEDIARLLWAELNLHCGTLPGQVQTLAEALVFFENWVQKNAARVHHHLGDLKRHIRTEVSGCR